MLTTLKKYTIMSHPTGIKTERLINSDTVNSTIRKIYEEDNADINVCEYFYALFLNNNNNIVGYAKIAQGGIDSVNVDIRILVKYAVETLSAAVIVAHNHPSGSTNVSSPDKGITRNIKEALRMFNISLLDHVILTDTEYVSMSDEGLI